MSWLLTGHQSDYAADLRHLLSEGPCLPIPGIYDPLRRLSPDSPAFVRSTCPGRLSPPRWDCPT